MATGFRWVRTPDVLAKNITLYGEKVLVAVHAVAAYVGQAMQDSARQGAPWTDRTANARNGLFFGVDGFGLTPMFGMVSAGALADKSDVATVSGSRDRLVLTLGHSVVYGKYLEVCNGGRYAIVMSTMEGHLGMLEKMLQDLLK